MSNFWCRYEFHGGNFGCGIGYRGGVSPVKSLGEAGAGRCSRRFHMPGLINDDYPWRNDNRTEVQFYRRLQ